jgi:hypothetical protein
MVACARAPPGLAVVVIVTLAPYVATLPVTFVCAVPVLKAPSRPPRIACGAPGALCAAALGAVVVGQGRVIEPSQSAVDPAVRVSSQQHNVCLAHAECAAVSSPARTRMARARSTGIWDRQCAGTERPSRRNAPPGSHSRPEEEAHHRVER